MVIRVLSLVALLLLACGAPPATESAPAAAAPPAVCHARGELPDLSCTPGAVDPRVTEANVGVTICRAGYTRAVRPPSSYTDALKVQQLRLYGYGDQDPRHYEEDHLIALELGGHPTDPRNLWPELQPGAGAKDRVENQLHADVCAGRLPLLQAQHMIALDWRSAAVISVLRSPGAVEPTPPVIPAPSSS